MLFRSSTISMSEALIGLPPGLYHFRPIVTTDQDVFVGSDATFLILGPAIKSAKVSGSDYLRTTTWSNVLVVPKYWYPQTSCNNRSRERTSPACRYMNWRSLSSRAVKSSSSLPR